MPRPTFPWVAGLIVLAASPATGQLVVEIDFEAGRTIISDEWRAMDPYLADADFQRGLLYVGDSEEPNGIMVFSLETGQWIQTIATPKGEGPYEFPYRRRGMALGPDGGLYVSGFQRIVEFDMAGEPVSSWTPHAPPSPVVCNFGGAPAVVTQGGVVRRTADGAGQTIGTVRSDGEAISPKGTESPVVTAMRLREARIACTEDRAYVVTSYEMGPDSVFVYDQAEEIGRVVLPTEGVDGMMDCRPWRYVSQPPPEHCLVGLHKLTSSFDEHGNLVLFGFDEQIHGVIIDPETGCHTLIRNTTRFAYMPLRVHADSVLVFHNDVEERAGRATYWDTATGASLHPLRRVSGESCPRMLPSVR